MAPGHKDAGGSPRKKEKRTSSQSRKGRRRLLLPILEGVTVPRSHTTQISVRVDDDLGRFASGKVA